VTNSLSAVLLDLLHWQ